ncbi:MAG: sugar-binding domain-containing protein [Chthoniobacteraceae bacterium]
MGWYRRHIAFPASASGKIAWLEFDGVFRDSSYWLDGKLLGPHQSGFIGNQIDLGPALAGKRATLAVWVDPPDPEGWWYDGGGIYRHISTKLENQSAAAADMDVTSEVLDAQGNVITKVEMNYKSLPIGITKEQKTIALPDARL